VTVTVTEEITQTEEAESSSNMMLLIPIIAAIVLIVIAIAVLIKCMSKKKGAVEAAFNTKMQLEQTDGHFDNQYQMKDDDKNIFARTTTVNNKLKHADDVSCASHTDNGTDVFGPSMSASVSKFSSACKMNAPVSE